MDRKRFLHQLDFAEQIIVSAARNWLTGGEFWRKVEVEFANVFGLARGATICQALESFLWVLDTSSRRRVGLGRLCCDRVWPDELRLIAVLGRCQGAAESEAVAQLSDRLPDRSVPRMRPRKLNLRLVSLAVH